MARPIQEVIPKREKIRKFLTNPIYFTSQDFKGEEPAVGSSPFKQSASPFKSASSSSDYGHFTRNAGRVQGKVIHAFVDQHVERMMNYNKQKFLEALHNEYLANCPKQDEIQALKDQLIQTPQNSSELQKTLQDLKAAPFPKGKRSFMMDYDEDKRRWVISWKAPVAGSYFGGVSMTGALSFLQEGEGQILCKITIYLRNQDRQHDYDKYIPVIEGANTIESRREKLMRQFCKKEMSVSQRIDNVKVVTEDGREDKYKRELEILKKEAISTNDPTSFVHFCLSKF